MIVLCSIDDIQKYARGTIYRTSVGDTRGMGKYEGIPCLYPLKKEMVWAHRYKGMSDAEYNDRYGALIDERWAAVHAWLESLQANKDITLLCYCPEGTFCHRSLIATLIRTYRPDLAGQIVKQ